MNPLTARIVYQGASGVVADSQAVAHALAPAYAVETIEFASASATRVDIQVFIEHVFGASLLPAERSFLLVNHEYLHDWDMAAIADQRVTALCKTHTAMRVIADRFGDRARAVYVGFGYLGPPAAPATKIPGLAIHLAGTSPFKGTLGLIRDWIAQHAQHAPVLLVSAKNMYGNNRLLDKYWAGLGPQPATFAEMFRALAAPLGQPLDQPLERVGSVYRCGYLSTDLKNWLQSVAAVHVCPSMVEGWGQYIDEGRRAGAVVVTLDAAPMNELIDASSGVLVPATRGPPLRSLVSPDWTKYLPADYFPKIHIAAPHSLGPAIARAFGADGARLGAAATARAASEAASFHTRLLAAVATPAPESRTARVIYGGDRRARIDCVILRSILLARGCVDVAIADASETSPVIARVDLQVFIDHVGEGYADMFPAEVSYILVDEQLTDRDREAISKGGVRAICRTRDAAKTLDSHGIANRFVGFGNPLTPPAQADTPRSGVVLRAADADTLRLMQAEVADMPGPDIYIVEAHAGGTEPSSAAIHVCLDSRSIDEGRRAGAVVVTLDDPRARELIDGESGILALSLGDGLRRALALSADERAALGAAAARRSADDADAFVRRFGELI